MTQEKIVDAITGEITYRDYTPKELAEREQAQIAMVNFLAERAGAIEQRKAILDKLGITEEEARLLLG
jgi:hypothetical protein